MLEQFNWENLFSWHWFSIDTLLSYHWDSPIFLYTLVVLPLMPVVRWLFYIQFREKVEISSPVKFNRTRLFVAYLRFLPSVLFILFCAMIVMAMARPQLVNTEVNRKMKGIDILFVLDVSESMLLEDFSPNRLEVSKKIMNEFIQAREQDKIGVVVFSSAAYSLVPLTMDYDLLKSAIDDIRPGILDTGATAIGNALGVGINRLRTSSSTTKIMILLTDGDNTSGNLGPEAAAYLAKDFGIKLYSIAVGREGQVPYGKDAEGNVVYVASSLNEKILQRIAQITGGESFRASDDKAMKAIFHKINKLEKNSFVEDKAVDATDYYSYYLAWGMMIFLLWLLIKSTFINNFMED